MTRIIEYSWLVFEDLEERIRLGGGEIFCSGNRGACFRSILRGKTEGEGRDLVAGSREILRG